MGYAAKIRQLCLLRGLDQAQLASRIGLSRSSLSRILTERQDPKLRVAQAIANALGVSLDYLLAEVAESGRQQQTRWEELSDDEVAILKVARRLGTASAMDRLLAVDDVVRVPGRGKKEARPRG